MSIDLDREAQNFVNQLWDHIYRRVRDMIHPHHRAHEPGGKDEVRLPLGFLLDVTLSSPTTGDGLVYDTDHWENGPVAATGGATEICGGMFGDLVEGSTTVVLTNLRADAVPYNKVKVACDPAAPAGDLEVTVTVGGSSYALTIAEGATASSVTTVSPAGSWASGATMSATITALTGTYTGTILVMVADGS